MARYRTRYVCPVRVATLLTDFSYQLELLLQRLIWLRLYPWVVIISLEILEKTRLHIWEPV